MIDELQLDRQGLPMPTAAAAEGEAPALADGEADAPEATGWKAMAGNLLERIKDSYGKIRDAGVEQRRALEPRRSAEGLSMTP
ncbi:MAG: hypothetical protein V9G23_18985 [Giesbergeria sp.]